jgi:hypothetical protein
MLNKKLIIFVFGTLFSIQSFTQCAMCKAVVEANLDSGDDIGSGLNDGILYLMATPYIFVLLFGIFFYVQNRKKEVKEIL